MSCKIIILLLCVWILNGVITEEAGRCEPLFMCPTFCMKVRDGCYVCSCGTFLGYLKNSAAEIVRTSNQQNPQTGSQLSSFTSGYGGKVENPTQTGTGTGFMDYRKLFESESQPDKVLDSKPHSAQQLVEYSIQNGGSMGPNFAGYGQSSNAMPGMNCQSVSKDCPVACWTTDVFSGCIHCECDRFNHKTSTLQTPTTSIKLPTTPAVTMTAKSFPSQPTLGDLKPPSGVTIENQDPSPPPTTTYRSPTLQTTHVEQKVPTPRTINPEVQGQKGRGGQGHGRLGKIGANTLKIPTLPPPLLQAEKVTPYEKKIAPLTAHSQARVSLTTTELYTDTVTTLSTHTNSATDKSDNRAGDLPTFTDMPLVTPFVPRLSKSQVRAEPETTEKHANVGIKPVPKALESFLRLEQGTTKSNVTVDRVNKSLPGGIHEHTAFAVYGGDPQPQTESKNRSGNGVKETPILAFSKDFHMYFDDLKKPDKLKNQSRDNKPTGSPHLSSLQNNGYSGYHAVQNTGHKEFTTAESIFGFTRNSSRESWGFPDGDGGILDNVVTTNTNNTYDETGGGFFDNAIDAFTDGKGQGQRQDQGHVTDSGNEGVIFGNVFDEKTSLQDIMENSGTMADSNFRSYGYFQNESQRQFD